MIGKVIAYGATREQAIRRMRIALSEMVVEGIQTNIPSASGPPARHALRPGRHLDPLSRAEACPGGEEAEVMAWLRLQMEVRAPLAEALSDALLEHGRAIGHDRGCARGHRLTRRRVTGSREWHAIAGWQDSRISAIVDLHSDTRALIEAPACAAGLARRARIRGRAGR
jgi:acetyl/propionyl-CoA carboxylase alpha subunit